MGFLKNGVFDWISRYTLITFRIHWPSIFGTTRSMTHSSELTIRDVKKTTPKRWVINYVSSKIVSVTVLDSRLSFFEPHLLWAYLFISLVRSSRCIMIWNQFWGEGVPKWKEVSRKKRGKINQIRLESGFFYFVFRKTFLKITWPRLISGLDAIQEILEV